MLAGVIFLQYLKSQTFFILRLQLMQKEVPKTSVYIRVPINHMGIGPNLVYHISISSFFSLVNSYTGYFSVNSASSSVTMSPFPTQEDPRSRGAGLSGTSKSGTFYRRVQRTKAKAGADQKRIVDS